MAKHRGFLSTHLHDKAVIEGWNDNVQRGDHVVVCGDFFWTKTRVDKIIRLLHGGKMILKGNHDYWMKNYPMYGQERTKIYEHNYKLGGEKHTIVACHYPMRSWNRKRYGSLHVHGHTHGNLSPHPQMMDVGVDVAKIMFDEWRPFKLEEIIYLLKGEPKCQL